MIQNKNWQQDLAALVHKKRTLERMGLRELAAHLGTSASTISRIENGESCTVETLADVCSWLGVSMDSLVKSYPSNEIRHALSVEEQIFIYLSADRVLSPDSIRAVLTFIRMLYQERGEVTDG